MCTRVQCACGLHRQQPAAQRVVCCFSGVVFHRLAQYARRDIHLQETLEYKRKLFHYTRNCGI